MSVQRTIEWDSVSFYSFPNSRQGTWNQWNWEKTKARMTFCFCLCSELLALGGELQTAPWLAGGWPRAQGSPGSAILPSYPAPPGPQAAAAPGLQEGSRGTASLEAGGRKLHLRSGFLQTARGAWGIEAALFLSRADKWNWVWQGGAEQAGRLNPGKRERKVGK